MQNPQALPLPVLQMQAASAIATAIARLPRRAPKAQPKASRKPSVKAVVVPTTYAPGPNKFAYANKKTWTAYMVKVSLKASTPAAATKLHKAQARRAGYNPAKPLDFKWLVLKGFIAPVA